MQLFPPQIKFPVFYTASKRPKPQPKFLRWQEQGSLAQLRAINIHCLAFKLKSSFSLSALLFLILSWLLLQIKLHSSCTLRYSGRYSVLMAWKVKVKKRKENKKRRLRNRGREHQNRYWVTAECRTFVSEERLLQTRSLSLADALSFACWLKSFEADRT